MKFLTSLAITASVILFPTTTSAGLASYCSSTSSILCYSWGVPESSASSGSGSIYLRIEASTKYQWAALGTGSGMSGSEMFVIYQDGSGNITLSTRKGHGHDTPQYSKMSGVKLLEGSGIINDTMVANIQCGNCTGMDFTGSNDWISAWKSGTSLDSTDANADINEHDGTDGFSVNFAKAAISSDSNPLNISSLASSGSSGSQVAGSSKGGADGVSNAHGIIMSAVFLVGYPIGAFLMPILNKWLLHAGWQILAFVGMWIGFGLGKVAADRGNQWFTETHVQLGTVVCILMILQPVLGWIHHQRFLKHQRRTLVSHGHLWFGRALMIIGIINGGIGLKLSQASKGLIIAYALISVVTFAIYTAGAIYKEVKLRSKGHNMLASPNISLRNL